MVRPFRGFCTVAEYQINRETGFDWGSLPKGAVVVDVGGGTGAYSLSIARAHPELELTIQDRPPIVEAGKAVSAPQL